MRVRRGEICRSVLGRRDKVLIRIWHETIIFYVTYSVRTGYSTAEEGGRHDTWAAFTPPEAISNQAHGRFGGACQCEDPAEASNVMRAGRVQLQHLSRCALWTAAEKLLLLCCRCCLFLLRARATNKIAVLWALGCVNAPHAHPHHGYARTAHRAPVASIDRPRMAAMEHTHAHTR